MSQIISTASSLSRAPTLSAEPAPERAGEAGDAGFAALLAGLCPQPLPQPFVSGPITPTLVEGEAADEDALAGQAIPEDALADQSAAGRGLADQASADDTEAAPVRGGAAEATGDATPAAAADRHQPAGVPRGAAPAPGGTEAPAARNASTDLPKAGAAPTPPPDGGTAGPAGAAATERRQDAARAKATNAAAVAEPIRPTARSSAAAGAATAHATNSGEAPTTAGPMPGFGRLGLTRLTWQTELAERPEITFTPSFAAAESVAGSSERAGTLPLADTSAGGAARPVQQLALAIERAVKGELRQLTIQLSPRDLGTIEITLELDAERRLTVAILAERPETLDLLRQDARQLERLLGQQGVNLAEAGLELGLMNGEHRNGSERPPATELELASADDVPESAASGQASPTPSAGGTHRLDLSI